MKKKIFPIAIVLIILAGAAILFFAVRAPVKRVFTFVQVQRGDLESTISCTGTLQFTYSVNVPAQVSGTVVKLYADYNKKVRKGDVLAKLDDTSYRIAVKSAKQAVDKAKLLLDQAVHDYDNTRSLVTQGYKTSNDLSTAGYSKDTAELNWESAKLELEKAELELDWTRIVSPVGGIVVARNTDIGQTVSSGSATPPFIVASDISRMQVLASVDESDISKVKVGQKVRFSVQAYSDKTFTGAVSQVRLSSTTVQNVVNYTVAVDVENKDGALLPGMTATMDMVTENRSNVLKVASAALKFRHPQDLLRDLAKNFTNLAGMTNARRQSNQGGFGGIGGGAQPTAFGGIGGAGGPGFGGPGGPGGPGFGGFGGANGQARATNGGLRRTNSTMLWVDDGKGGIRPMRVRTGLTDGAFTEIISSNVTEGMQVVTGIQTNKAAAVSRARNPFQAVQQGGGNRGPR